MITYFNMLLNIKYTLFPLSLNKWSLLLLIINSSDRCIEPLLQDICMITYFLSSFINWIGFKDSLELGSTIGCNRWDERDIEQGRFEHLT